ncbi:MAG: hypothetical protein DRR19_18430, partial [Candidatus Parabeggiatoa sp. nov. 1]
MRFKPSFSLTKRVSLLLVLVLSLVIPKGAVLAESHKTAAQFDQTLQMLTDTLEQLQAKEAEETNTATRRRQESTTVLQNRLNEQIEQLLAVNDQVLAEFAALEEFLRDKNLPDLIWKRHFDAQEAYQKRLETLLERLEAIPIASDAQSVNEHAGQALELLKSQKPPTQPAFDPEQAPFGLPKTAPRAPFENETELHQWLSGSNTDTGIDNTRRATRGGQSYSTPITPDIQKLAQQLGHKPVAIYNWVHDNIVFVPTYGAINGVDKTLDTKQGNAFEIASVMVALLKASGVEAKYGMGTVNIGIERVKKWLGAESANAAINRLAQARIPHRAVVSAGQVKSLKIEHIWAEGFLDFEPSKGAKHQKPDTWISLDASFKQHTIVPGTNLTELVPFDIDALRDHLVATTQVDARGGVFGIDSSFIKNRLTAYKAELENYIETNELNPADLIEKKVIVPANRPELAAGLPYEIVARTDMVDEIGAHLTHQLTIKFYHSQSAQNLDNPTLSYTLPLPAIGTQRLSVTYVPATDADAQALEQFRNSDATELPLYLFNVKPQLQLDGTVLAEGTAIGLGQPQYYTLTLSNPHDSYNAHGTATAGDEIVLGVNGSGMTPELVQKRLDAVPSDTAAENMHQAGLHFWMEHDLFDKIAAQAFSVHVQRMPSVGSFSIPLSVNYFFGIPRSGNYRSRQVDVKLNLQIVVAETETAQFNFMSQIGMHGSYLEGSVLDQLFGRQRQPGISAAQLLMEANDQGIPIYTITADNVNSIRPILNVGDDVQLDITNAIHAGKQVIVPQRELVHGNWKGAGYIIQDPVTGVGAYLLSGGLAGGGHETCEISLAHSVHPMSPISLAVQQMINEAFTVFLASHFRLVEALLSEEIDHTEYFDALQMAVRTLAAKVAELATETAVGGSGCFVAEAYGLPKQIALPLFYDWEGERQTDVDLSVAEFAHCRDHAWQIRQHLEDETSTVIGTSDQAALTYAFSSEGQYTAQVSALCQEMGPDRVESSVDITIHDLIATVEFCDAATEGNPVHPATGATVEQQTLLSVQGLLPIEFRLQYHSLRLGLGSTGRGWEASVFGASLQEQANGNVRIHWSNNHYNDFNKQADGHYKSPQSDCVFDKLLKNPDGGFTVTRNNQTVYQFSAAGQLVKIGNRRGQFLELAYNSAGQVAKVTEPVSGVFLEYHYQQGLLVRVSDPLGRQATLVYDEHHNLVSMTDGAGQTTTLTYNNKGQLLTKTNAERLVVSSHRYDERGRVISQEDGNSRNEPLRFSYQSNELGYLTTTVTGRMGQKRLYVHDQEYNLLSFTDELGYKTRYSYNAQGQRTRVTDAKERTNAMAYDSHGNLASFSDAAGNVTSFVYDEKQNLVEATNALGQSIRFGYDSNNNLTRITDADSNVTRISYTAHAQVQTVTQPRGGVTRYYYTLHTTDPTDVSCQNGVPVTAPMAGGVTCTLARPVLVVSAEGTRGKLAYDQAGRLVRITDGDTHSVTLTYDGLNRLLSVSNPLGHTASVTYNSRNNPTTTTDANGNLNRRFYDTNGNLVVYINALNQGTGYDYDGEDRLIRVVDATNRATQLGYDAKNRLVSLTNPLGQTQTLEYDAVDNLIKRVDAVGQSVISLSYDNRDNLTHVSDALGNTTAFHYDALSRLIQTTDQLNRVTQFRYDNHNRLVESLDAFLGRSTQQFDADGHRQKLTDAKNNDLQFDFDFSSRLVQETDATANQVSYTYNARDLLAQITNGRGQQRNIEYDAAGRITRWTDPDGSVSYTYDANGNVLTVTDSLGTITREYDQLNRVTKYIDSQHNTLQYLYDEVGNLVTLTYPDGRQVHYEYDAANRLVKVIDWAARVTEYEYDQNGRLINTLRPNGTQQTRAYDPAGQLLQLKDIVIATGDVISQFDFRYDAAGNITQ